jgi:transcriptional regulator with XRE-family HTH domain
MKAPPSPDLIKAYRKENKLTQKELGKLCGVSKAAVSNWEKDLRKPNGSAQIALNRLLTKQDVLLPLSEVEIKLLDAVVAESGAEDRTQCLMCLLKTALHKNADAKIKDILKVGE